MTDSAELRDRVAIVTGGGRGIGLAIGRALRAAGAEIVVADLDAETGEPAAEEMAGTYVGVDVTDPDSVRALVAATLQRHGRVDVLVNNAGIAQNVAAEELTDDDWRTMRSVNLDGVFWCCREVGKAMLERGSGAIVNVASMSGVIANRPQPQAHYNAAKAGVIMLTKSLAGEWARRGVRVNAVSPGYVGTDMTKAGAATDDWLDVWMSGTPMGRFGEPDEIAPAVVFLASERSSFATGTNLVIDGGYTSW